MLAWIIFIILIGLVILRISRDDADAAIPLIFIGFVWIIVFGFNQRTDTYKEYRYETKEIHSVFNRTNTEGEFFLGTGTIDGNEYYYVMFKNGDLYDRGKYSSSNTSLKMSDEKPHIKLPQVRTVNPKGSGRNFWWSMWTKDIPVTKTDWYPNRNKKYILVVPKNTIRKEFYIGRH